MNKLTRALLSILFAALLCLILNAAAFTLNSDDMQKNAAQGLAMLAQEGASPELVGGFSSARLDNFTAALMVKTAAHTGSESLLRKTLGGLRVDMPIPAGTGMEEGWQLFCRYASSDDITNGSRTYSRYWHGYLFPLRLLLSVFTLANIQMLLYYAQMALLFAVVIGCAKRAPAVLPGLLTAFFLLMPAATGVCLQYMPVTLTALAACCLVLYADKPIASAIGMPGFFALMGLVTNFLDLLTFPLLSLGFPLALYMAARIEEDGADWKALFTELFFCGLCWGLGYGGMWAFKWALTGLCFGGSAIADILGQAAIRVSSATNGEAYSRFEGLARCLNVLFAKPAYLALMLLTAAAALVTMACRARTLVKDGQHVALDPRALLLLLLAAVPLCWTVVLANHCYDHFYFTYRILTVSVLSGYAAAVLLVKRPRA